MAPSKRSTFTPSERSRSAQSARYNSTAVRIVGGGLDAPIGAKQMVVHDARQHHIDEGIVALRVRELAKELGVPEDAAL